MFTLFKIVFLKSIYHIETFQLHRAELHVSMSDLILLERGGEWMSLIGLEL